MITKLHIRPAQGLKIRDPKTQALIPEEGLIVEQNSYWVRRLKSGDVIIVKDAEKELAHSVKPESEKSKKGDK